MAARTAWHYTTGDRAALILSDGVIKAATAFVPDGEKPVVWFSTRQRWEPTATKGIIGPDGIRRDATLDEMIEHGGGLYRFGLPASELIPWNQIPAATGMSRDMARALVKAACRKGADPSFWFASMEPVIVLDLAVQWYINSEWIPIYGAARLRRKSPSEAA